MMIRSAIAAALLLCASGCGGTVTPSTSGTGGHGATSASSSAASTGGGAGTGGTGGLPPIGDCLTDADCGGAPCVTLGGYNVCVVHVAPVTSCGPGQMGCCDSDKCAGSALCYPPFGYCGGIVGPQNKCLEDECQSNDACLPGHVCVPAGVLAYPVKTCMPASCLESADCGAHPGGRCEPVEDPCCAGVFGLFCVYPGACRTNADCPADAPRCYGDPATGTASCKAAAELPGCPI